MSEAASQPLHPSQRCLCCDQPSALARCARCDQKGCTFGSQQCDRQLLDAIAERRQDAEFMARLRERMEQDGPLLDRLRDGECGEPLVLVESRNGGELLIYQCPVCGGKVARTREQAEADASPANANQEPPAT